MQSLETDKKSSYFIEEEQAKHYQEIKRVRLPNIGWSPFFSSKTDALIVNKRYGYDKSKEKLTLYQGIDVLIEDNQPFHSPMNGQIVSVPDTETLVIEKRK